MFPRDQRSFISMARFLYIVGVEYDEMYYRVPLKKQFCGNLLLRPSSFSSTCSYMVVDGDKVGASDDKQEGDNDEQGDIDA